MRNAWTIARRELKSYFASPIAYVLLAMFAVVFGYFFLGGGRGCNRRGTSIGHRSGAASDRLDQHGRQAGREHYVSARSLDFRLLNGVACIRHPLPD